MIPHSKPTIGEDDVLAVDKIVSSGMHADGKTVKKFEKAFAEKIGTRYAIATSSGSAALYLALLPLGIKNNMVYLPSYTCRAVLNAIQLSLNFWEFTDIDEFTLNMTGKISNPSGTNGIMILPYMFGNPECNVNTKGLKVIEDYSQAIGSKKPKHTATFSFYSNKMIASGHGGMVTTNDEKEYKYIMDYLNHDEKKGKRQSFNLLMSDIHAALGMSQLKKLDKFVRTRREIAHLYVDRLGEDDIPIEGYGRKHVFYRFIIFNKNPDKFIARCKKKGVDCRRPVYRPLHLDYPRYGKFPVTDKIFQHAVSIPIYPSLTVEGVEKVISVVKEARK